MDEIDHGETGAAHPDTAQSGLEQAKGAQDGVALPLRGSTDEERRECALGFAVTLAHPANGIADTVIAEAAKYEAYLRDGVGGDKAGAA